MEHSLLQLIYAQVPEAGVNHFGQSIIITQIYFLNVPCSFVAVVAHQEVPPDSSLSQMSFLLYGT